MTTQSRRADALIAAQDAAALAATKDYRLVTVAKPFAAQGEQEYNHLTAAGEHLSLCEVIAIARPAKLPPARLELVDCIACLDEFTKRTRPAGSWLA